LNCFFTTIRYFLSELRNEDRKSLGNAASRSSLIESHREKPRVAANSRQSRPANLNQPELNGIRNDVSPGIKGAPKDVVQEHANNNCDSAPNAVTTEKSTARKINARDKKKKRTHQLQRFPWQQLRKPTGKATVQTGAQTAERPA
jgi:hypothetical protein